MATMALVSFDPHSSQTQMERRNYYRPALMLQPLSEETAGNSARWSYPC